LALLHFTGTRMNLLMTMLPPLIYVLSISSAVHFANYYRDALGESSPLEALRVALRQGSVPCVLAAATTSIGLASLVTSKIDPIREFGMFSAAGVILGVGILFLLLPAALHLFPPRLQGKTPPNPPPQGSQLPRGLPPGRRVVQAIGHHHGVVVVVGLAMMAFCGAAFPHLQSTVKLQDRFLPGSDAIGDYQWLEREIGPMVPLEVVLHFDNDDPRDLLSQLRIVSLVQAKLQRLREPVSTFSAVNLSPPLPSGASLRDVITRKLIDRPATRDKWTAAKYLAHSEQEQLWRITVRANAIGDLDYGRFADTIRRTIEPVLNQHDARATYTGVIPLIYKAQRQLLSDLFRSFLAAFAVIAVVLIFVLRSIPAAILAMIPNLFPAVVVFGGMQWIGIPLQIGSVMTASAALGIAVDDTVHFLTWFRHGLGQGQTRSTALGQAFARCSGAMIQTTLICSSGLVVFAASSFVPILHFAWLMVFLLLAALVGDLILLPAILAGPFGRWFERKPIAQDSL
jgi:predicted RND superfamily exporter protein